MSDSVAFRDVSRAIVQDRRPISAFILTVTAAAIVSSFLLPVWYTAGAEFSVESAPTMLQPTGALGLAAQLGLSPGNTSNSIDYYGAVLASDRVLDVVALHPLPVDSTGRTAFMFTNADSITTARERDKTRRRLRSHLDVSTNPRTNTLSFMVDGKTPYAARAAAETILASLNRVIIALRRQRASAERTFLETRVDSALDRQRAIEDTLREFYVHNRLVNTPNLLFTEGRLKRDVEFAQTLVSQLRGQLEQARLQEVRDTPALSVIASPEFPGRKSRPNRKLIVLAAFVASCLTIFGWAALRLAVTTPSALERERGEAPSRSATPT